MRASDGQMVDEFGSSVSIYGDTLAVGAPLEDGGPGNPNPATGAVYIFERNMGGPDNWGERKKLTASDGESLDEFGYSVDISGDTIVVGAYGAGDGPFPFSGSAYIFERDFGGPDNWGELKILTASNQGPSDRFGWSVGISDDILLVGAYLEDGGPGNPIIDTGAAYVFERNLGGLDNWGEAAMLGASDAQSGDFFGGAAALNGSNLLIGAFGEDGGAGSPFQDAGSAYLFEQIQLLEKAYLPLVTNE